ncbi:MAG: type II secretion system protein, partial [Sulfurovum sp.]|nr:type II secretion system protein [Sulfurovum sp.]
MIRFSKHRDAIAMIELIFSIVVMGIVMMSAPMLISTASKTTSVALQQEGIHEAASRVNMIMTYEWDENALNGVCSSQPPILKVTNGDEKLKPSPDENSSFVRAGTSDTQDSHRF